MKVSPFTVTDKIFFLENQLKVVPFLSSRIDVSGG